MISREDIRKAIEDCHGESSPNSTTCIKLAAYYTILNNMDSSRSVEGVMIEGNSEFFEAIQGTDINNVIAVMDELMDGIRTMIPQLYNATLDRLKSL